NGSYLVRSLTWNANRGAATWGSGTAPITGIVSQANSLVGTTPGDRVGSGGVTLLGDGHFVVRSPSWFASGVSHAGAATWVNGSSGQTLDGCGIVSPQNSVVGQTSNTQLQPMVRDDVNQAFVAPFAAENSGRVAVGLVDIGQLTYGRAQAQTMAITP